MGWKAREAITVWSSQRQTSDPPPCQRKKTFFYQQKIWFICEKIPLIVINYTNWLVSNLSKIMFTDLTTKFMLWYKNNNILLLTKRSQILTSPSRQPEATIWLDDGWKAKHQGVLGCPSKTWVHFPVAASVILTLWSPWVEAIFVLIIHFKSVKQKKKKKTKI